MLQICTQWQWDAEFQHPMAAGCFKFAANGGAMLNFSA
jgi:hypothetical protein